MLLPPNRRSRDRRIDLRIPEPLERKSDRRDEERRDSGRPFRQIFVRSSIAPLPLQHRAALSLAGATWTTEFAPPEDRIELLIQLPDMPREVIVPALIERRRDVSGKTELYATFLELDLKTELALARFIDARMQLSAALFEPDALHR